MSLSVINNETFLPPTHTNMTSDLEDCKDSQHRNKRYKTISGEIAHFIPEIPPKIPPKGLATLSIKQPAAALILYRGKNVENRSGSKFRGGGQEFNKKSYWVLIQTGQLRQKPEPILSLSQLKAASNFQKIEFADTVAAMTGVDQTTGSIVGAMLVSEQRPADQPCNSVWASENENHIMIEKTIAFSSPQKCKGALCLFPVLWDNLNDTIQQELEDVKDQFIMRQIPPKKIVQAPALIHSPSIFFE
tara:strand:+ start:2066 stop:2803 length:738 start_codon:yes stop_codon:yes gene_type:complete